jgi:tripartite-type tricarboxylate transporter receptor subunit TctC
MTHTIVRIAAGIVIAVAAASAGSAESYPSKAIRLIVPTAAGAPPDVRARWIAERLRTALGQPVVIENKAGASGMIGTHAAIRSPADGYTLLMVHQGVMALNPHFFPDSPYDPIKDLAPIIRLGVSPLILAVHPDVPARSVAEFMRLARENPGQLNFGHPGVGTPPHVAGELFKRMGHLDVVNVTYKTHAAMQIDLVSGRLTYTLDGLATQLPNVRAGSVRALAVTSAKRLTNLPEIPTVAESGLPGYEYLSWMGLCAPAGTPKEIISRLNAEVARILRTHDARDWFAEQGADPVVETPGQFVSYIKSEYTRLGKVIREAGIKGE